MTKQSNEKSSKKLRLVHYPQIPCEPYIVHVDSLQEAHKIMNVIANYDLFLLEHNHRPDFSNAIVLETFDVDENEWVDWYDDETGIADIDEYFEFINTDD